MATELHNVKIMRSGRVVEAFTAHLDVKGDQTVLHATLRQLLLDAVDRSGWNRQKYAHEFTLTARKPGWAHDAFPPYVIPRQEV